MFARAIALALLLAATSSQPAQRLPEAPRMEWAKTCKDWDDWAKAGPPFRVFGNTYYVGTCGISAILIVGDHGDILIDGGPANAAPLVVRNVEALGIRLTDVKLMLHTHEHHDHAGALAELQRQTGARLLASPEAAKALATGKANVSDPQFEENATFPAARIDGLVKDGEVVGLGKLALTPIATPGHTPGAMSWQWRSCERNVCKSIVYADSLTPVSSEGYRFSDHPRYLAAFRASLDRVAALRCDILLSPHPSASGMRDRLLKGTLAGPPSCKEYAARLRKQLDERIAKEAHGA